MVMDHAEALERIEIAAAEPDGLDRLMAGDTADGAAIAGHLAGCPACGAELVWIRRTAGIARDVIRARPDAGLRARTLAFVAASGVPRGAEHGNIGAAPVPDARPIASPEAGPAVISPSGRAETRPRPARLGWIAAIAAAVVVALGVGYLAGTPGREQLDVTQRQVALLEETTEATLRIQAQPDATRVNLEPTGPGGQAGTLLFSPSSGELVMVATGLAATPPGDEYGCWVESDGTRERIGRMYWAGELWTWAGPVDGLESLPAHATFGVSLGPAGGGPGSVPVLAGEL
jgi:hypothetical protein